jgi:hypothetical protein
VRVVVHGHFAGVPAISVFLTLTSDHTAPIADTSQKRLQRRYHTLLTASVAAGRGTIEVLLETIAQPPTCGVLKPHSKRENTYA